MRLLLKTQLQRAMWLTIRSFGDYFLFSRTEVPLFWLSIPFQDLSGQEIRYCPHNPLKMTMGSALAIPESAAGAKTSDSVELAAAVSSKLCPRSPSLCLCVFVQGAPPPPRN